MYNSSIMCEKSFFLFCEEPVSLSSGCTSLKNLPSFWRKPVIDGRRRMKTIGASLHRYSVRGPMREGLMRASSSRLISEHCNRSPNSFVSDFMEKKSGIWLYRLWSLSSQVLSYSCWWSLIPNQANELSLPESQKALRHFTPSEFNTI